MFFHAVVGSGEASGGVYSCRITPEAKRTAMPSSPPAAAVPFSTTHTWSMLLLLANAVSGRRTWNGMARPAELTSLVLPLQIGAADGGAAARPGMGAASLRAACMNITPTMATITRVRDSRRHYRPRLQRFTYSYGISHMYLDPPLVG